MPLEEEMEIMEEEVPFHDMMELFENLSFRDKWRKVASGLKMPKDTGEYKWARLQIKRLTAPVAGVIVPVVLMLFLTLIAAMTETEKQSITVTVRELPPEEELEEPPDIEEEPLDEPPDPTEVDDSMFNEQDVMMEDVEPTPPSDFAPQPALFDAVAITKSPVVMRGIYGSRSPGARGRARGKFGGSGMTEGAVMRALRWLKKNQNEDGSWNSVKPAMTGLALLTFLAHGETPASEEFGMTVEYAIRWLIENQNAEGRFNGRDGNDYSQPIAAYALCEAYGLTKVPTIYEAAMKAVTVVVKGQNPSGGFTYKLKPGGSKKNDSSYMSWCTQALKAAYMAGMDVDGLDAAMKHAIDGWKCNYGGDGTYGGFGYSGPSKFHGLSGSGALCMMLLGEGDSKEVRTTVASLERATFNWDGSGKYNKMYYWYYITQVKFHEGEDTWTSWNKLFAPVLIREQIREKNAIEGPGGKMFDIGHWAPGKQTSGHTDREGKVMNTCLSALQLQVYYRYLPTFTPPDNAGGGLDVLANGVDKDDDVNIQIDGG